MRDSQCVDIDTVSACLTKFIYVIQEEFLDAIGEFGQGSKAWHKPWVSNELTVQIFWVDAFHSEKGRIWESLSGSNPFDCLSSLQIGHFAIILAETSPEKRLRARLKVRVFEHVLATVYIIEPGGWLLITVTGSAACGYPIAPNLRKVEGWWL